MKQLQTTEKQIGEAIFYIRPFPAFTAANLSGELTVLFTPLLGGLAAIVGNEKSKGADGKIDIMNLDIDSALPAFCNALTGISGDQMERIMKKLMVDHKNISVSCAQTKGNAQVLTMELANEVFCQDLGGMFILCYEVIKVNYGDFFGKLGLQSGKLKEIVQRMNRASNTTEPSTSPASANLS